MKYTFLEMAMMDYRYSQLVASVQARSRSYGEGIDLTVIEVHTLYYIYTIPGITLTQLSEMTIRTKSTISPIVNKLVTLSLIRKVQSASDKRVFSLEVTEKGKDVVALHEKYNEELYREIVGYLEQRYGKNIVETYYDIVQIHAGFVDAELRSQPRVGLKEIIQEKRKEEFSQHP